MEFFVAGIEARQWPIPEWASADASEWDIDEDYNDTLAVKFKLEKNRFQLLNINNEIELKEIIEFSKSDGKFDLVVFSVPKSAIVYNYKNLGFDAALNDSILIDKGLIFRGYDVCDLDGFFTILNSDLIIGEESNKKLVQSIAHALEVAHDASIYEKNHAPYSIVKVFSVQ